MFPESLRDATLMQDLTVRLCHDLRLAWPERKKEKSGLTKNTGSGTIFKELLI